MNASSKQDRAEWLSLVRAFDAHAEVYDRMVGVDSQYHEQLRISARRMGLAGQGAGLRLLDVGCGTGASTAALLDAAPEAEIVAVDSSQRMLEQARAKTWPPGVRFVHADLDDLDPTQVAGPFDGIMAGFLLRNTASTNETLRTLWALLRPGAPLAVHEYSVRDSARSRMVWTSVCWGVIIPMARLRAPDIELYRHLWRSVLEFDGVDALVTRMHATGFDDVRVQTMPGWQQHIVHTFLGRRPAEDSSAENPTAIENPTAPEGVTAVENAAATTENPVADTKPLPHVAAPDEGSAPASSGYGNETPTPPGGLDVTKPEP